MTVFSEAMRAALQLTRSGDVRGATRLLRDALQGRKGAGIDARVVDGEYVVVADAEQSPADVALHLPPPPAAASTHSADVPRTRSRGRFLDGFYTCAAGTRAYK